MSYYGEDPWSTPGDALYVTSSAYVQDILAFKKDHNDFCPCESEGEIDELGRPIEWNGSGDSMRWAPGLPAGVLCDRCSVDHEGAECPSVGEAELYGINYAGSERYFLPEPAAHVRSPQPHARREDAA